MKQPLSDDIAAMIQQLLIDGMTCREVSEICHCSKSAVLTRRDRLVVRGLIAGLSEAKPMIPGNVCDQCGHDLPAGQLRNALRVDGKLKHKFCSMACYGLYRSGLRHDSTCKGCGKPRELCIDDRGTLFVRGMCRDCYEARVADGTIQNIEVAAATESDESREARILMWSRRLSPATVSDVVRMTGLEFSIVSNMMDALCDAGLLFVRDDRYVPVPVKSRDDAAASEMDVRSMLCGLFLSNEP